RGGCGNLRCHVEGLEAKGSVPKEHLEDQKPQVQQGNQSDEQIGDDLQRAAFLKSSAGIYTTHFVPTRALAEVCNLAPCGQDAGAAQPTGRPAAPRKLACLAASSD